MWGESTLCSPKFRAGWIYECGYDGIWCIAGVSVEITVELVSHGTFVGTHNFLLKIFVKRNIKMFKKIYFKTFSFLLLLHVVARCERFSSLERKLLFIALSPRQSRIHIQVMEISEHYFLPTPCKASHGLGKKPLRRKFRVQLERLGEKLRIHFIIVVENRPSRACIWEILQHRTIQPAIWKQFSNDSSTCAKDVSTLLCLLAWHAE